MLHKYRTGPKILFWKGTGVLSPLHVDPGCSGRLKGRTERPGGSGSWSAPSGGSPRAGHLAKPSFPRPDSFESVPSGELRCQAGLRKPHLPVGLAAPRPFASILFYPIRHFFVLFFGGVPKLQRGQRSGVLLGIPNGLSGHRGNSGSSDGKVVGSFKWGCSSFLI